MVTKTLTTTTTATKYGTGDGQYARIACIRNMDFLRLQDNRNVVVPVRTEANPSPMKQTASNRQPGQSHTRTTLDAAINQELAKARYLMDDLADHVFGHIVPTELARDILRQFVHGGIVEIFEEAAPLHDNDDIELAIEQAFEDAMKHGCIRTDAEHDEDQPEPSPADEQPKRTGPKRKGKQRQKTYSFKWSKFPSEPIDEDELVKFLNDITDCAFAFARPVLARTDPQLKNRFATREDKHHAMPLSYEPDGEDMRPDFLLLPMEAFVDDFKTVDGRYLNFTATRLVGEAKNKDLLAGIEQVQRYARGLKRAQPWIHYVLAMTITKDKAVFMRGEGSGTERLELILGDGRGCVEFIRILLGLALAEDIDLGQNPDVCLGRETRTRKAHSSVHHGVSTSTSSTSASTGTRPKGTSGVATSPTSVVSEAASKGRKSASSTAMRTRSKRASSVAVSPNVRASGVALEGLPISSRTRNASKSAVPVSSHVSTASSTSNALPGPSRARNTASSLRKQAICASSASSKRSFSEVGNHIDQVMQRKKRKVSETVAGNEHVVFFPLQVYGHSCLGVLFTSSSIRGRGTTVFCVLDLDDDEKKLALKMSWQDLQRMGDQDAVMKRLKEHEPHPNVIAPLKTFYAQRNDMDCTTLDAIRGFLDEQMNLLHVENRVLTVSISELKRPMAYFWGVHDFIRGLRGALLGHEFLTKIGILHRDISENNIVLGLYPWEERGYLIDFDMAILQEAEKSTLTSSAGSSNQVHLPGASSSTSFAKLDQKHVKGLRTGTFPYISCGVLLGGRHTHFDDVESFLYVLLLFFFSYAGPLEKAELAVAHGNGFVRPIGSGRLTHARSWPSEFANWAEGDPKSIGRSKSFYIWGPEGADHLAQSDILEECLQNNWTEDLHSPIRSLLHSAFTAFWDSTIGTRSRRTEVSHGQFIRVLDDWLETYSALEHRHSHCPDFEAPTGLD